MIRRAFLGHGQVAVSRLVTPIGTLSLACGAGGLAAVSLPNEPCERFSIRIGAAVPAGDSNESMLELAMRELEAYFAGTLRRFTTPLDLRGTPFQRSVWQAVCAVPFGQTASYGAIAAQLGRPAAARAVGHANGANPLPIVVPCHRLIGADGSLTGYAGGLPMKRWLQDHERALIASD